MNITTRLCARALIALLGLMLAVGCSGGNGGGGEGAGEAVVISIQIEGFDPPIHPWPYGAPLGLVHLNPTLVLEFGGAVDPSSLPQGDLAEGSIEIRAAGSGPFARGTFHVQDDPTQPANNRRRVVFQPRLPSAPGEGPAVAFLPDQLYTVTLRSGTSGLEVGGQRLSQEVVTSFATRPCVGTSDCLRDPVAGAPHVIATFPETTDPDVEQPPVVDPISVASNTVFVYLSEALDPETVSMETVVLRNAVTQAPISAQVTLSQPGSFPRPQGVPVAASRVNLQSAEVLPPSVALELILTPTVSDLHGNQASLFETPDATPQRVFRTLDRPLVAQQPLVEEFTDTQFRGDLQGPVAWEGTGELNAVVATDYYGDSSDGEVIYATGNHDIATGIALPNDCGGTVTAHASPDGILNGTWIAVGPNARVRVHGTRPLDWRSSGQISIYGVIDGSGFSASDAPCYPDAVAANGLATNISPFVTVGGRGGPGAGAGGMGSYQGGFRTARGGRGDGPFANDLPTTMANADDRFGGGEGGLGAELSTIAGSALQVAGMGGAGGTAFTQGESGDLLASSAALEPHGNCGAPVAGPSPSAQAPAVPLAWTSPITRLVAGSGGGAGGDYFRLSGAGSDAQGGGGGGGGGGIRLTSAISILLDWSSVIRMDGAPGGAGAAFAGSGGGGSGGMIWLRTPGDINAPGPFELSCRGGGIAPGALCGGAPGRGGDGVIILEDQDGLAPLSSLSTISGAVLETAGVHYTGFLGQVYTSSATSSWRDTGEWNPEYRAVTHVGQAFPLFAVNPLTQTIDPGIEVEVQGTHGTIADPSVPDPLAVTPWMPASAVVPEGQRPDDLDGHRFVRFRVVMRYWENGVPQEHPSVDSITIEWAAPVTPF